MGRVGSVRLWDRPTGGGPCGKTSQSCEAIYSKEQWQLPVPFPRPAHRIVGTSYVRIQSMVANVLRRTPTCIGIPCFLREICRPFHGHLANVERDGEQRPGFGFVSQTGHFVVGPWRPQGAVALGHNDVWAPFVCCRKAGDSRRYPN